MLLLASNFVALAAGAAANGVSPETGDQACAGE